MQLMCERMVQQQLYACASVLTAPRSTPAGDYANLSAHTSFRQLLTRLASHLESEAEADRFGGLLKEEGGHYEANSILDGDWFESDEVTS